MTRSKSSTDGGLPRKVSVDARSDGSSADVGHGHSVVATFGDQGRSRTEDLLPT